MALNKKMDDLVVQARAVIEMAGGDWLMMREIAKDLGVAKGTIRGKLAELDADPNVEYRLAVEPERPRVPKVLPDVKMAQWRWVGPKGRRHAKLLLDLYDKAIDEVLVDEPTPLPAAHVERVGRQLLEKLKGVRLEYQMDVSAPAYEMAARGWPLRVIVEKADTSGPYKVRFQFGPDVAQGVWPVETDPH